MIAQRVRVDLLALVALTALVFANALGVTFVLDDMGDIADNPSAHAATFLDRLAYTNRPLTKATYALNDALHGSWPAGYALVNVALHLGAVTLVFLLLRRAFRLTATPESALCALAAVALWALHPALTESVTYLSGRSMVLSATLMLAALLTATGERPRPLIAFICAALAPLARETALILPLILLWWQWTVGVQRGRTWPVWLGTALAAVVIALMPRHRELLEFSLQMRDPMTALRGNLHAATETLGYWFTPWRVTIFPDAPPPYGWTETPTLLRIVGFAIAGALAFVLRRRVPLVAFGIGMTLLALAPAQTVIWRADPVALKPLYLAGLGLSLVFVDLLRRAAGARATLAASIVLAAPLAIMTMERNVLFSAELRLYEDAVGKTPENADAWIANGSALVSEGRYDDAEDALTRGLDLRPHDEKAMNLLDLIATIRGVGGHSPAH
jgi:hypothetical protein